MISHEQPAAKSGAISASRAGAGMAAHRGPMPSLVERRAAGRTAELSIQAAEGHDYATGRWEEETDEDGHRSPPFTSPPPLRIE